MKAEHQQLEWKEAWRDERLKCVRPFAEQSKYKDFL